MPIEAVIFDMDGVLVDSEIYWEQARKEFARDLSKVWTDEDQRLAMGRNTVEWAHVMQERLGLNKGIDDIIGDVIQRVIAHYEEWMPIRPGALEAVQLATQHYRVALASGSPTPIIKRIMQLTELDQVFEVIVYGDDIPNGKPAPDIYLETLRQLGVKPENSVGLEDSPNGVRALKAAGMFAIAAPSPGFPLPGEIVQMADAVIESFDDFSLKLIQSLET